MHITDMAPKVPLQRFKRTKIIATLGPATDTYEKVKELIEAGANVIRCNFSHGTHEDRDRQIPWIRQAAEELGKPVAIIQDLQGPKVRLGDFDGMIQVHAGDEITFAYGIEYQEGGPVPMQYDLSKKAKAGERLYIYDGKVRSMITEIGDGFIKAKIENDGIFLKRKGMNLPDTDFGGDILTEKDMRDIHYGVKQDFDYVAISFVQTADDIHNLRKILTDLGSDAKIIVKFETKRAVDNIEAIVKATDVLMVARGDLAVETPAESVPVVQRQLVSLGQQYGKPTVVATQMLLSMVDMPEPTRAEVSDVATAVFIGADAVMLSDETAAGKYPIEAVKTMKKVVLYAEQHPPLKVVYPFEREHTMQNAISTSVLALADNINATAIVAETHSGTTALEIAAHRPNVPLIAVTDSDRVAQQLTLVYGIKSYVRPAEDQAAQKLTDWLRENDVLKAGDVVVSVSGRYPGVVGTTDTIKVRILE